MPSHRKRSDQVIERAMMSVAASEIVRALADTVVLTNLTSVVSITVPHIEELDELDEGMFLNQLLAHVYVQDGGIAVRWGDAIDALKAYRARCNRTALSKVKSAAVTTAEPENTERPAKRHFHD